MEQNQEANDAAVISRYCLQTNAELQLAQTKHRLRILQEWRQHVRSGAKVLEIGEAHSRRVKEGCAECSNP